MTREELEHIIRASADVTDQYEFVIVGSQSMLGPVPRPEAEFTVSMEADIYPLQAPELADEIDGAIGEGSQFHQPYGYYAQGVGPETAMLPVDWMRRVHRVQNGNTNHRVGYCLDVPDLFMAKAAAGRARTGRSAWRSSSTAMWVWRRCWQWSPRCRWKSVGSARCARRSADGPGPCATPATTCPRREPARRLDQFVSDN